MSDSRTYERIPGRRYDKIVSVSPNGSRCAEVFIDQQTGAWHPASSWSSPNKRYWLSETDKRAWAAKLVPTYRSDALGAVTIPED